MFNQNEQKFLIWSVEHGAWWKSHHCGYTYERSEAGIYDYRSAKKIVDSANIGLKDIPNEAMIPVEN